MAGNDAERDGSGVAAAIAAAQVSAGNPAEGQLDVAPPWRSDQRVTIPGRVTGYLDRKELAERCAPTDRRLTVLKAPGGFGKTTLLAECCRNLAGHGVPVAWLSLDGEDESSALDMHIAHAFQRAGLDDFDLRPNGAALSWRADLIADIFAALDNRKGPWVLALDNLQTVTNRGSVAGLNALVRNAPSALHLAMSCREFPVGLDIAGPLLEGAAEILTEEDLRFSRSEIERFFDGKLSRRELVAVAADSAGWPIALRIERAARAGQARERDVQDLMYNWIESSLWRDLVADDREFLLDVGLFEVIDAELLEEVLGGRDSFDRLNGMSGVAGPARTDSWERRESLAYASSDSGALCGPAQAGNAETLPASPPQSRRGTGQARRNRGRHGARRRSGRCGAGWPDPDGPRRRPALAAGGRRTAARGQSVSDGRDDFPASAGWPSSGALHKSSKDSWCKRGRR